MYWISSSMGATIGWIVLQFIVSPIICITTVNSRKYTTYLHKMNGNWKQFARRESPRTVQMMLSVKTMIWLIFIDFDVTWYNLLPLNAMKSVCFFFTIKHLLFCVTSPNSNVLLLYLLVTQPCLWLINATWTNEKHWPIVVFLVIIY